MSAPGDGALLRAAHPWIGRVVTDTATGRRGVLRAVDVAVVAWLRPVGGGCEWTTAPDALTEPAPTTPTSRPATAP
ncbi:hypothetical protein ACOZGD_37600 [Streptomyces murinus]